MTSIARTSFSVTLPDYGAERVRLARFLDGRAFVGGEWVATGERIAVADPASNETIGSVAHCDPAHVARAVDSADAAFRVWGRMMAGERGAALRRWASLIRANEDVLARLMTLEQGKPPAEAVGEIRYGASFVEWFAAEGERAYGETIPSHKPNAQIMTRQQPVGIVLAVTPWNFPSAMVTRKAAAALAAGCTVIVKPAPETPFSALALAVLAEEAGFPAGVFQVVTGDAADLTQALLSDNRVRAVSFTGSTRVGRIILAQAAQGIKRAGMELGGHAPFLIFEDADPGQAAAAAMAAKFATSGQDCLAANRIYAAESLHDDILGRMADAVARLRVGHGLDPDTDIGPMTHGGIAANCSKQVDDAVARGARLVVGDGRLNGNFVTPTLLAGVREEMLISREETFGPVAALLSFRDEEEVVARANATEMGLAAYLYTNDLRRALRLTEALQYGMVAVNTASFTGPPVPFGGWKQSGLGREGARQGLMEFTETKYVCFGDLAA
jgi:succinate-semialdehyde dehydrogenase/glutarate-semialdehyde dehydrogenase/aspartate-semialdehyde dehydrogenase